MDHTNGTKRRSFQDEESVRPQKRTKTLLDEGNSTNDEDSLSRAAEDVSRQDEPTCDGHGFTINQEYARRFEHNKKREEQQKRE